MRYKTAFRLAIKLIGVFLVASHAPWLLSACAGAACNCAVQGEFSPVGLFEDSWELRMTLIYSASTVLGLYLFFGGRWIVDRAIPSNRPYCHECGYELTGLAAEGECPECGTPFRHKRIDTDSGAPSQ